MLKFLTSSRLRKVQRHLLKVVYKVYYSIWYFHIRILYYFVLLLSLIICFYRLCNLIFDATNYFAAFLIVINESYSICFIFTTELFLKTNKSVSNAGTEISFFIRNTRHKVLVPTLACTVFAQHLYNTTPWLLFSIF